MVFTAPVGWLRGVFPCFAYCPTSSVLKRSSLGFSASSFALSLRDGVTLPGRVCLNPRSERRLFLHLPVVWLVFAMGSPCRVGVCPRSRSERRLFRAPSLKVGVWPSRWGHPSGSSLSQSSIGTKTLPPPSWCVVSLCDGVTLSGRGLSQISIGTKTFSRTFFEGWCLAFAMGSPISGRVALFCALDRNEGVFHSSILSCFAMGSPCGSSVWFSPLDRNEADFG